MPPHPTLPPRRRIAAYLLAGGASSRMGQCKARLDLDGEALVLHLARALSPWVQQVSLVAKPSHGLADLGLPIVCDATAEHALVHGVRAALQAPGPEWRLLCACDMPGVGPEVIGWLWEAAQSHAAPGSYLQSESGDEPLPSLWHEAVGARLAADWGLVARDWLHHAGLAPCRVQDAPTALRNLNTPEDWRRYRNGHA